MKDSLIKKLYISLGFLSLLLGIIGLFLPIMPTTPFVILAAWFFQKGSEKLHQWLISQPYFGPAIHQWQSQGLISKQAKITSITLITISFSWVLITRPLPIIFKIIMATLGLGICFYIGSRPSKKAKN